MEAEGRLVVKISVAVETNNTAGNRFGAGLGCNIANGDSPAESGRKRSDKDKVAKSYPLVEADLGGKR